jgi:hypothetical protein
MLYKFMILLIVPLLILPGKILLSPPLIIYGALLGVAETCIGLADFLKGLLGFGVPILIRVYLQ